MFSWYDSVETRSTLGYEVYSHGKVWIPKSNIKPETKHYLPSRYNGAHCGVGVGGSLRKMDTSVQLAFRRKRRHAQHSSPKQTCDKRKRKQMWKGEDYKHKRWSWWVETRGRWMAWIEGGDVAWAIGLKLEKFFSIRKFLFCFVLKHPMGAWWHGGKS